MVGWFGSVPAYRGRMPANLTIQDVPDDVCAALAALAARSGQSLAEYLRARLIELARGQFAVEVLADLRLGAASRPPLDPRWLLEDVAADRR